MRAEVTPRHADIVPGVPIQLTITVTNTSLVIGGYAIRMLGADPGWVHLDTEQVSLFPDESRTVTVTITPPAGIPAGSRRIAVQVRELTPPHASMIHEVDLTVPAATAVQMRVDPLAVTAGRRATFGVLVENTGNTIISGQLAGDDPEGQVDFAFVPDGVTLAPGEHALVDMRASARRRLTGSPSVRMLSLYLDQPSAESFFEPEEHRRQAREESGALASATFVQKAVVSRGPLAMLGLLAAVTIFAIVITLALGRLVGQSTADRDLALQVAAAGSGGPTSGSASIAGTVRLLSSQGALPNVTVSLFTDTSTDNPLVTTATDRNGTYRLDNLAAGKYKLSYRGAGFVQVWYPAAADVADSSTVTLEAKTKLAGIDVTLGGVPATVSGSVVGDDVSASTLYLMQPGRRTDSSSPVTGINAVTPTGAVPPPDNGDAIVQTVPIGADGMFSLTNVPSPSTYDFVVTKAGYATTTQRIDIGAGETRNDIQITLNRGDGLISGRVNSSSGPLSGATITATSGQTSATTVSVSGTGAFTLHNLPTPATFTVVATLKGYAQQTQTLTLAAQQKLQGVEITMPASAGSLHGSVTLGKQPAPGVSVTVTDGSTTVQTQTQSQVGGSNSPTSTIGDWKIGGLTIPGSYTVTFARADLETQTVAVSLDANSQVTQGSEGATVDPDGRIHVAMQSATAIVFGRVTQHTTADVSSPAPPVGEVTVSLDSATTNFTVVTASVPSKQTGRYRIADIPPGTWTLSVSRAGTRPTSTIVTLSAGEAFPYNPALSSPASIAGRIIGTDDTPRVGWTVQLYQASQYPDVVAFTTTTGSGGAFKFPDVDAPEAYVIVARPTVGSAEAASKTVQITPSEHLTNITILADPNG